MVKMQDMFESMPACRAIATLALPAILSQLVTMVYNLADIFFVGQLGDPNMVAAVSLGFPAFMTLTVIANLFGIGGGSLISRMLGAKSTRMRGGRHRSVSGAASVRLLFWVFSSCYL